MKLLVTENRPEDRVGKIVLNTLEIVESVAKWSSWSPKTSSRNGAVKPQHGKAGKARGLVSRSFVFPRFPRFPGCSKSILEPGSSGLFLVSRSSIFPRFPRFPCCSGFTFGPCSSSPVLVSRSSIFPCFPGWLFGPSQHPPGNPGKRGNGGSDLPGKEAGVRGPMVFFVWACRGCNNAKRYDVQPTLGPDHGSQRKARRFCLSGRPPPVRAFDSPERPADPRRAVLPQHHRPVLLAVRQLRDFNRGP